MSPIPGTGEALRMGTVRPSDIRRGRIDPEVNPQRSVLAQPFSQFGRHILADLLISISLPLHKKRHLFFNWAPDAFSGRVCVCCGDAISTLGPKVNRRKE